MIISVSQAWEVRENGKDMKLQRTQNLKLRSDLPQLGSERQTRKAFVARRGTGQSATRSLW